MTYWNKTCFINTIEHGMHNVYIPESMYLQGIPVCMHLIPNQKILKFLTKTVIWLAFSEILPETSNETAKTPNLRENRWKMGKFHGWYRPVALLVPNVLENSKISLFHPLIMWYTVKIDLTDRWCLKWNFTKSNTKNELLGNFANESLRSHDLHVSINRNDWQVCLQVKFC